MRWQHTACAFGRLHSLDAGFDLSGQAGIVWLGSSQALAMAVAIEWRVGAVIGIARGRLMGDRPRAQTLRWLLGSVGKPACGSVACMVSLARTAEARASAGV